MMGANDVVQIEFYGVLTQQAGQSTMDLPLVANATLADVLEQLAAAVPAISAYLPTTACAIDDEIVQRSATVKPGAKLALLPPVSGG